MDQEDGMHAQESSRCQHNVTTKSNPELTISRFEKALKMFDIKENENCCNIPQKKKLDLEVVTTERS